MKALRHFVLSAALMILASVSWASEGAVPKWKFATPERLEAIGDIHGDLEGLLAILRSRRLIDKDGAWSGGKTHLVLDGDLNDRGPDTRYVFDFLMALEKQAEAAGGAVHSPLGNHEAMVVRGDISAVTEEELAGFSHFQAPGSDPQLLKDIRRETLDSLKKKDIEAQLERAEVACREKAGKCDIPDPKTLTARSISDEEVRKYDGFGLAMRGNSKYADWLNRKPAILLVGDTLFMHGGISKKFLETTPENINSMVRSWLLFFQRRGPRPPPETSWVMSPESPMWSREVAYEKATPELVNKVLETYGAKRLVLGHTVQEKVRKIYNDQVWLIDTGISANIKGKLSSIAIQRDGKVQEFYPTRDEASAALREAVIARFRIGEFMAPASRSEQADPCP